MASLQLSELSWSSLLWKSAMLEPRYPPTGAQATRMLEPTAPHDFDAAVDLSRKSSSEASAAAAAAMATMAAAAHHHASAEAARAQDDSDEDAPLDLKVRPPDRSKLPVFPGLNMPGPQQRAELLRIAELYTSGPPANSTPIPPSSRDSSQERDPDCCEYCGSDSRNPEFVPADHREGVCNRGSIACTLCAKTFTLYSHYEAHKKCHQKLKQRQYPCQTCGKIFTSASNRNMHQRIHKGVRPFQCTPCGVFFRQKAHLQKHQKTQGHIQASDLYEKKRLEGNLNDGAPAGSISVNNNTPAASSSPTAVTIIKRDDQESFQSSEDTNSSNCDPIVDSSSSPLVEAGSRHHAPPVMAADSSSAEDDNSPTSSSNGSRGGRSRFKSSPKRKQSRPQYHSPEEEEEAENNGNGNIEVDDEKNEKRADRIRSFVDYNDVTHGYECRQCAYSSHDLSVLKTHVGEEHLSSGGGVYKCRDCQITFSKEFNLRIHNRKHETSSQFLPCDHCEQVFKVPNKLIKHMEGVHSVCPTCGNRQEDKASLLRHQEDLHGDMQKRGFHTNLLQFTPLNSMKSPTSSSSPSHDNSRAAKMRKVDSLAETIRQKQLQNHATSTLNGNEPKSPLTSPGMPRRRKNDMSAVKALLAAAAVTEAAASHRLPIDLPMNNQSVHDLLRKSSENNNFLSSLKLPPSIRLPTHPVSGLTPPSSPPSAPPPHLSLPHHLLPSVPSLPPPYHHTSVVGPGHQIRGEVSVTIMPTRPLSRSDDSEDQEENGLDLSIGKGRRGGRRRDDDDENHVTTTAKEEAYTNGLNHMPIAPPFPHFPFFGGLLPPVPPGTDPVLTEHLMKLTAAGLPPLPLPPGVMPTAVLPPLPPPRPSDLSAKPSPPSASSLSSLPTTSHPYTVLSAMLGQPPYQPLFPGMANSIFPKQNGTGAPLSLSLTLPPPPQPVAAATVSSAAAAAATVAVPSESGNKTALDSKPFSCTYCSKEFSHLSSLESHLEHMHSGDTKHACAACGKNFSSKSNLTAHRKIHSGERPFECAVCHKTFRQKAHLQKHETTHSSATPYQCTVCDKAFGHPSNLNTHMATHSNVRPFSCSDCGKSYKDSASFKRHRLQHTGERPYPCSLCAEAFIDSKSLRRHREVAHPTALPDPDLDSLGGDEEEEDVDEEMQEDDEDQGNGSMLQSSSSSLDSDRDHDTTAANASTSSAYSSFESQGDIEDDKEEDEDKEIKVDDDDDEEEEVVNENVVVVDEEKTLVVEEEEEEGDETTAASS